MSYYFAKKVNTSFDEAIQNTTKALKDAGFGIVTEIDFTSTMKDKLNENFRPYHILGACKPAFALKAVTAEPHIGLMLPCNVVVQQLPEGSIEVSAVDPAASMASVQNSELIHIAGQVGEMLKQVIESL